MRNKKILLILLPILLVLIVVGVIAILYFTTDMFKSNDILFAKYFVQNGEVFNIMQNENLDSQSTLKNSNTYTSNGELLVTAQKGTDIQEIKATTATRHDVNTGRIYSEINLKNGAEDLLKVSYINSSDVYAIKCDAILANYIGIRNNDLKTFAKNMGISDEVTENIPNSIDLTAISNIGKITEEQKQHIVDTYSKVLQESIATEKFSKLKNTSITVNNTNYNANGYVLSLDVNDIKQIFMNCLTKLKDDNITLAMVSNKLSDLGLRGEYIDITNISKMLEELVTEIQSSETTSDGMIVITAYEYKGTTIKTEIILSEEGRKIGTISIDKINENNTKTAIITVESNYTSNSINITTGETDVSTTSTEVSQITLQKITTDTGIINKMTFVPNTTNMLQFTGIDTTIGKVQNNIVSNNSNVTISSSSDGINIETVNASYTQNIQATDQVEEIMELKNSNTVIVNNYTLEQLGPFFTDISEKISLVIPYKIGQLQINLGTNQNGDEVNGTNNLVNTTNDIYDIISMIGAAGVSIANVNGVNISYITGIGTQSSIDSYFGNSVQ